MINNKLTKPLISERKRDRIVSMVANRDPQAKIYKWSRTVISNMLFSVICSVNTYKTCQQENSLFG